MTKKFKIILALARHFELFLIHDNLCRLLQYRRREADNLLSKLRKQKVKTLSRISGFSQSEEISSDLRCFCGGGISHNEDALFSKVYCCLIRNYPTPIEIWIWKLVVRALM